MDNCKIVKLKTGEVLICRMSGFRPETRDPFITIYDPVQVAGVREAQRSDGIVVAETFVLRPWMGLSESSEYTLSSDIILTMGDAKKSVLAQYEAYLKYRDDAEIFFKEREDDLERSEAAETLLRELNPNYYRIIADPYGDD